MHSRVFNYIKSIYFNDNNGSWGQYKSNVMASAQIPLKFGSEIVINSAFVILSHNSPKPTMNFPVPVLINLSSRDRGNFQSTDHISKGKSARKETQARNGCRPYKVF